MRRGENSLAPARLAPWTAGLSLSLSLGLSLLGCLEASGPERPGYSAQLRDKGDTIAALENEELFKNQVDNNDGITAEQSALRTGFAAGEQVNFWDLGTAPAMATLEPLWTFRRRTGDGDEPLDHPDLIDSVPGEMSYSPLRSRNVVYVTAAYAGEQITSLHALEDAIDLGLAEEPAPPTQFVHRPVALSTARLPTLDGGELAPEPVYYRGRVAHQFRVGGEGERMGTIPMMGPFLTPNLYRLRRRNQSLPIDEPSMASDLDGDGDQNDTNLVFAVAGGDERYRGLWSVVDVTVPASYVFGASKQESDLFARVMGGLQANEDAVLDWRPATDGKRHIWLLEAGDE